MQTLVMLSIAMLGSNTWYPVDEMDSRSVMASATNGPLVLISKAFHPKLILFDFEKQKAMDIEDGRLRMMKGMPVPFDNGFAIVTFRMGSIYFLDSQGSFLRQIFLRDLQGWDDALRIKKLVPASEGNAYLTLRHNQDGTLIYSQLNLHKQEIVHLYNQAEHHSHSQYWLGSDETRYFVNQQTGFISRVSQEGKQQAVIQPAREPLIRPAKRRRNPHHARIEWASQIGGVFYFSLRHFEPGTGKYTELVGRQALAVSGDEAKVHALLPHGHWQDQWLVVDQDNGVFRLTSGLDQ